MSNVDLDIGKKLRQTNIKKYWKYTSQVKMELDWLYDWILALSTFVRHSHRGYDHKNMTENMKIKQDISLE